MSLILPAFRMIYPVLTCRRVQLEISPVLPLSLCQDVTELGAGGAVRNRADHDPSPSTTPRGHDLSPRVALSNISNGSSTNMVTTSEFLQESAAAPGELAPARADDSHEPLLNVSGCEGANQCNQSDTTLVRTPDSKAALPASASATFGIAHNESDSAQPSLNGSSPALSHSSTASDSETTSWSPQIEEATKVPNKRRSDIISKNTDIISQHRQSIGSSDPVVDLDESHFECSGSKHYYAATDTGQFT
jgi:hypothetical protein